MHLKSYQIDSKLLRTGAANFSASGLKRQDNDLIVIESAGPAAAKQTFEARFASGEALPIGPGKIIISNIIDEEDEEMRHGPRLSDVMTATLRPLATFALLAWLPAFAQTYAMIRPRACRAPAIGLHG
jgi:phosphatidylserine/phosphatidylglycerophosphate/cardiolipin synthase-like enzyme